MTRRHPPHNPHTLPFPPQDIKLMRKKQKSSKGKRTGNLNWFTAGLVGVRDKGDRWVVRWVQLKCPPCLMITCNVLDNEAGRRRICCSWTDTSFICSPRCQPGKLIFDYFRSIKVIIFTTMLMLLFWTQTTNVHKS